MSIWAPPNERPRPCDGRDPLNSRGPPNERLGVYEDEREGPPDERLGACDDDACEDPPNERLGVFGRNRLPPVCELLPPFGRPEELYVIDKYAQKSALEADAS